MKSSLLEVKVVSVFCHVISFKIELGVALEMLRGLFALFVSVRAVKLSFIDVIIVLSIVLINLFAGLPLFSFS